jgi:putative transcriptional regulator
MREAPMHCLTQPDSAWARVRLAGIALLCSIALCPAGAGAQQDQPANGVLLIAKPELDDPNFSRSVVLVTQAPDYSTVGVILNRPTTVRYEGKPVWMGGPVMRQVVVALFRAEGPPPAAAFHVLKNVYLSMLQSEFEREGWYVLPADEATVFREDTTGLWEELVARAAGPGA